MDETFRELIQRHRHRVYTLAAHLVDSRADAEEIAQDTLLKLWHRRHELSPAQALPWLVRVTRNACVDLLRRRGRRPAMQPLSAVPEPAQPCAEQPEQSLARDHLRRQLVAALTELDEPFHSLVVLRELHGLSYRAIAEALELSDEQVKVYLHRARRKLRHRLTQADAADASRPATVSSQRP